MHPFSAIHDERERGLPSSGESQTSEHRFGRTICTGDTMMSTTHGLAGMAVASLFALGHPEYAGIVMGLGFLGGVFPDSDLYVGHRKTFHFPVYYWIVLAGVGVISVVSPGPVVFGLVFFLLGAALHSTMDVFGGGLELRPWENNSERAVYNHAIHRWHRPRRWIRYDGAPEDTLLGILFAIFPAMVTQSQPLRWLIGGMIAVSIGYTLLRRKIPATTEWMVQFVPYSLRGYVPERFVDG